MQVAVLLDENVVENVVGHAVLAGLHDGGIGQGLMVGHVQALVLEMEAVAHPAAVESLIGKLLFEVLQNFVVLLLIEVLGRSLGVVVTELDGNVVLPPALDILRELVRGIVLVEHAVDALGRGDRHLVRSGDRVEHPLQVAQLGERLTAGENEVALWRDGVHHGNGPQNRLDAEAGAVGIFLFIDTERAVIAAVIRHKNGDRRPARPRFVGVAHSSCVRPIAKFDK